MKHGVVCNMCMSCVTRPVVRIRNYEMREFLVRISGNLIRKFDENENENEQRCELAWDGRDGVCRQPFLRGYSSNWDAVAACCGIAGAYLAASEQARVRASVVSGTNATHAAGVYVNITGSVPSTARPDAGLMSARHTSVLSQRRTATTTGGPGDTYVIRNLGGEQNVVLGDGDT